MSVHELLAVVLGTGTRGKSASALAESILGSVGGLASLARATPRELVAVSGVGSARATRIVAGFHLCRRAIEMQLPTGDAVRAPEDVYRRLRPRMSGLAQEIFVVLALDVRNVIIDEIEVARGHLCGVDVHPREVFRPLIRQAAAAAIVAHNHPSGDPTPSGEDLALTRRLRQVGDLVGIPVLDHIVIGASEYRSLAEVLVFE
jgi:DNA repair protein RadC